MVSAKRFQRKIEDFVCAHCGVKVKGSGYTDHCPVCLWSRHVDVNPGDRASECGGMMEPVDVEMKDGQKVIHYRCVKCKMEHRVKALPEDNEEEVIRIIKERAN